jgi:ABC-2 type transport system ATP-binding protein
MRPHYRRSAITAMLRPMPAGPPTTRTAISTRIELQGLSKSFGAVHAVKDLDLQIAPGEVVALLGPNGAGKSTTLDMLLGLTAPDRGRVVVFGRSPHDAIAEGAIGAMLQVGGLIRDLTVRELVASVASLYPTPMTVDDVLDRTGITDIADRRTQKLSGGQAQRVRFALALVPDPDLLVLDEPTVAMDVTARKAFWASMRNLTGDSRTVIFATHYLEEADLYADRIVLMASGRVVADGPTTEIKGLVGGRTIRGTLRGASEAMLRKLPGVTTVELHGDALTLTSSDSDATLRALLPAFPELCDIEVRGAGLEEAFLELTRSPEEAVR